MTLTMNLNLLFKEQFLFNPHWTLKTSQTHETAFFFIHWVGLEGPPNHLACKVSILCKCKQTLQLLVKIKSDPFVNKQPGVQHEGEFGEG